MKVHGINSFSNVQLRCRACTRWQAKWCSRTI